VQSLDHLDFLDIVAILLGIAFTIAKLDAQSRQAAAFPHVPPGEFERWRRWTTSIYRLGSSICFARVLFHQVWSFYVQKHPPGSPAAPRALMYPAMAMDALFLGLVVSTFFRAARARELRRQLGIVLAPLTPQQQKALAPDHDGESEDRTGSDQT
jgi:hypothetical protein